MIRLRTRSAFHVLLLALATTSATRAASPPQLMNYQAVLRSSAGQPLNGNYDVQFALFDSPTGATNQILVDLHSVTVANGLLNADLGGGSVTDGAGPGVYTQISDVFRDYSEVWMEIEVGPQRSPREALSPRVRIVAAAYAFNATVAQHALSADSVSGFDPSQYVDTSASAQVKAGKLGLGPTGPPTHQLTVQSASDDTLRLMGPGALGSAASLNFGDGDYVYLREFLDDFLTIYAAQSTSLMGGYVGVNTLAPEYHLDVNGYIRSQWGGLVFPDGTTQASSAYADHPRTPQQIALQRWYESNQALQVTFSTNVDPHVPVFDGEYVWVASDDGTVRKIRSSDNTEVLFKSLGHTGVLSGAFDGSRVWFGDYTCSCIIPINVKTDTVGATVSVGVFPEAMVFDGTFLWVAGGTSLVKLYNGTVLSSLSLGAVPGGLAFDGTYLWVSLSGNDSVQKIRAADGSSFGTFSTGDSPSAVAFDGTNVWIANSLGNSVTKLRASDGALVGTYNVGSHPEGLVFDGFHIWVKNDFDSTVTKLRARDGYPVGTFATGCCVPGMAFDGAYVWVVNPNSAGSDSLIKH